MNLKFIPELIAQGRAGSSVVAHVLSVHSPGLDLQHQKSWVKEFKIMVEVNTQFRSEDQNNEEVIFSPSKFTDTLLH